MGGSKYLKIEITLVGDLWKRISKENYQDMIFILTFATSYQEHDSFSISKIDKKTNFIAVFWYFFFTLRGPLGGDIDPHLFPYPNKSRIPLDEEKIQVERISSRWRNERIFSGYIHHFFNCNDFMWCLDLNREATGEKSL